MKLTDKWPSTGKWVALCLIAMALAWMASAQTVTTTTVQGTVYLANGMPGTGTLQLSWPAFTTANNQAVAAGRTTATIGADGFVSVNLAPNVGSWPAGLYYTATYYLSDGTTSTEYWVVPAAAQASIAQVRAQVMPAAQAIQAVSKAYVDQAIQSIPQSSLTPSGGTMSGPLYLSGDPLQTLQAADKHYVDSAVSQAVPLTGATLTGPINGPSVSASVNKVLLVTAPPYNAKCDGVTDDQAAIQAAFNDAVTYGYSVQFPAGTCLTSTVTIKGQSFFGAGVGITFVKGQPGQDVFATPDAAGNLISNASIHDLTIEPDASVNAASSVVGGNNTFPNRITGTAGGTTPLAVPPAPGPMMFTPGSSGNCGGSMSASSSTLTVSCGYFTSVASSLVVGEAITVNGAGTAGANLVSTVASVVNGTQVTLASSASTAVSNATVTLATPMTPPWYIGNCGIALPASSGAAMAGGLLDWSLTNVYFQAVNGPNIGANYVCGLFLQAQPYAWRYTNLDFMNFYAGLIEALPVSNNTSENDWTPDTSSYKDINFRNTILPMVWYNGSNRAAQGINVYGTQRLFTLGMWQFAQAVGYAPTPDPSATITRYYDECFTPATGEHARFSTDRATADVINGSDLAGCGGTSYLNFATSSSTIEGKIGNTLRINGNQNTFRNTALLQGEVTDNGLDNSVQAGQVDSNASWQRRTYNGAVPPQEPVGKLDAGFVLNGNSTTPFLSSSDLVFTARDFPAAIGGTSGTVVNDPTGTEITHSYVHTVGTASFNSGGAGYNGLNIAGTRVPLDQAYVLMNAECEGAAACYSALTVWDSTANAMIGSCYLNFTSTWSTDGGPSSKDRCLMDFSSVAAGDLFEFRENTWGGTGLTGVRRAFIAFQPTNTDVIAEAKPTFVQKAGDTMTGPFVIQNTVTIGTTVFIDSGTFSTLAAACSAAATAGMPLLISKVWTSVPTQTCAANLTFMGGSIQPAASAVFTASGVINAGLVKIFDTSVGGVSSVVIGKLNAGVYPQWFGGQTANDSFDNTAALNATQNAAVTNGVPILITGRMQLASVLYPLSNTTWQGVGPLAEIVGNPASSPASVVSFCGTYPESPSTNACVGSFVTSTYVHPISPALRGATTITSNPTGGFANIAANQWILLVEGNSPKWNTYMSYHKVNSITGDTITLDRPTEFDFTGATGATNFGVISINPATNITMKDLRITMGATSAGAYVFGSGLSTNILLQHDSLKSESSTYPLAYAYANDSYNFRLKDNTWLSGMFGGWNRGSWGVEEGSIAMNIGSDSHEEGEGANHLVVRNGFYGNQSGTNALFAGPGFYWTIDNNEIVSALNQTPISVDGVGERVTNNRILGSYGGLAFSTATYNSDMLRPHDQIVEHNYVETRLSQPCLYAPYNNNQYDVTIAFNTFNCPNPVVWNGGVGVADTNTLTFFSNKEIVQAGVTPTAGITGYTTTGAASGGSLNATELSSIPILGGFLKTMYAFPVAANHQTFNAGDIVIASPYTSGAATTAMQIYTASGTYGTLAGVTGSTVSGSNVLTITAGTVVGQRYYTIAGVSGTKKLVFQLNATQWQMDSTANATVTGAALGYANPTYSTIPLGASLTASAGCAGGTSGYANCQQSIVGGIKTVAIQLNGYAETGSAQTWNYPTAFYYIPAMVISGGSCGTYNPTTTANTFTFPANAAMTAENCQIMLMGQ
jgi:hypothetical protein